MLMLGVGQTTVSASDYYQESLYFDEDGNFFMTTHDAVATKPQGIARWDGQSKDMIYP